MRRSTSNNINSLSSAEANGTIVQPYTANISTANVLNLNANTNYYFTIIVKDSAGNKAAYLPKAFTTAFAEDTKAPTPGGNGRIAPSSVSATSLTLNWIKRIRRQIACSSPRIVALVVGHQPQLELRNELKELAVQEPGADRVAAGQRLEPGFGKALPILGLDGADHARAREPRHVVVDV